MKLILCVQYYACANSQRQWEIDHCLQNNLNHPAIDAAFIWVEPSAPPVPTGSAACEILSLDRRATYADWLRLSQLQSDAIVLLANADIAFESGLDLLRTCLPTPALALALTRHQPQDRGPASLHPHPHWSQDAWAIRSDAPIDSSLLHASTIPLGLPGCDNRIAHVLWSHGFSLSNPCHHIRSLHRHQPANRSDDQARERLFGACTYVHAALAPTEPSELEHVLWTRSPESSGGLTLQLAGEHAEAWPYARVDHQSDSSFVHQTRVRRLLEQGRALDSQEVRAATFAAEFDGAEAGEPSGLPLLCTAERILLPVATLCTGTIELTLTSTPVVLALAVAVAPGQSDWRLLLQSRGPGHDWSDWLPAAAGPTWRPQTPQRLIHPPFPRQVAQLRLRLFWPEGEPQPELATDHALLDIRVYVAPSPPLLAPDTPLGPRRLTRFGQRFDVLAEGNQLHWVDRFWPWSYQAPSPEVAPPLIEEREELFRRGFVRPLLEWKPGLIRAAPARSRALLVWDADHPTEELAWLNHSRLGEPVLSGGDCDLYVGLPWSTFSRRQRHPQRLLEAYGTRIQAITQVLSSFGRDLRVHSVCQHPQWQEQIHLFQTAGVSDLWLSHRPRGMDSWEGLRLHPWPLLPGAALQQGAPPLAWEQRNGTAEAGDNHLERRQFCLCHGDADPGRLWQSLAAGCIPVLVGARPQLPTPLTGAESDLPDWDEVVLVDPGTDRQSLERRLAAVSSEEGRCRQILGMQMLKLTKRMTCFLTR